jgi:hypothetical protein
LVGLLVLGGIVASLSEIVVTSLVILGGIVSPLHRLGSDTTL